MSRFANIDSAEDILIQTGLPAADINRLIEGAQDALLLLRHLQADADVPIGASKLAGAPDLPADMPWPIRPAYANTTEMLAQSALAYGPDGYVPNAPRMAFETSHWSAPAPLNFLIQLDLETLAQAGPFDLGLPATGRLLVFADIASFSAGATSWDSGWIQVIHDTTPVENLVRTALPQAVRDIQNTFNRVQYNIPQPDLDFTQSEHLTAVPVITLPLENRRYPFPVVQALEEMDLEDMSHIIGLGPNQPTFGGDQLGGHPSAIQNDVPVDLFEAARPHLRPVTDAERGGNWNPYRWTHLLTIAGESYNPAFPSNWGDGDLYIAHRPDPARPGELGQVWAISQQS